MGGNYGRQTDRTANHYWAKPTESPTNGQVCSKEKEQCVTLKDCFGNFYKKKTCVKYLNVYSIDYLHTRIIMVSHVSHLRLFLLVFTCFIDGNLLKVKSKSIESTNPFNLMVLI